MNSLILLFGTIFNLLLLFFFVFIEFQYLIPIQYAITMILSFITSATYIYNSEKV